MAHRMARVAQDAGFENAAGLEFPPTADMAEIWATTTEVCGVSPDDLAEAVASTFRVEVADLASAEPTAAKLVPGSIARKFGMFLLRDEDRYIVVATSNPADLQAEQEVGFASGRTPTLVIADQSG